MSESTETSGGKPMARNMPTASVSQEGDRQAVTESDGHSFDTSSVNRKRPFEEHLAVVLDSSKRTTSDGSHLSYSDPYKVAREMLTFSHHHGSPQPNSHFATPVRRPNEQSSASPRLPMVLGNGHGSSYGTIDTSKQQWGCNVCNEAYFPTRDQAHQHEEFCRLKHQNALRQVQIMTDAQMKHDMRVVADRQRQQAEASLLDAAACQSNERNQKIVAAASARLILSQLGAKSELSPRPLLSNMNMLHNPNRSILLQQDQSHQTHAQSVMAAAMTAAQNNNSFMNPRNCDSGGILAGCIAFNQLRALVSAGASPYAGTSGASPYARITGVGHLTQEVEKSVSSTAVARLALPEDSDYLNERECFLRSECVEMFEATEDDTIVARSGRRTTIKVGQVGMRCVFCVDKKTRQHAPRSVCYPSSLKHIRKAMDNWREHHFKSCPSIPEQVRIRYSNMSRIGSHNAEKYRLEAAKKLGLVDCSGGGIRFE
jgi:hypothetical protein